MTDLRTRATTDAAGSPDAARPTGDPAQPAAIVAQRGLYAGPRAEVPDEMYAEVLAGDVERHRRHLRVGPHAHVSTNTYFGRFPASWWQRWTPVREVRVTGRVSGRGRLLLRASDTNGVPRTLAVAVASEATGRGGDDAGTEEIRLAAPLDRFLDGGGLWIEIVTDDDGLELHDVRWIVDAVAPGRTTQVVICTHNRADDCLDTLATLGAEPDVLDLLAGITVVDQGTDALEGRPAFAQVEQALGARFRYVRQPNLGGSGGFTRGLHDAVEHGAPDTDVLFMDDDVRCEPEVVVRLAAFGRCTTHPTIVGAQMLNLLHPTQVLAGAEYAVLTDLTNGHVSPGAVGESDVTSWFPDGTKNVQDRRVDAGYTGWWSCLIPAEVTRALGYPLPLFFQWDDVEYCVRARGSGVPVVTLPGAGLWHADFPWKDWDDWHRYFNLRNAMITAALHSEFPVRHIAGVLADLLGRYLVSMNYGLAATLVAAVEDFLDGPAVLDDGGAAAVGRVRELRRAHPETVMQRAAEVTELPPTGMEIARPGPEPSRPLLVMAKRLVQHAGGRMPRHDGLIGAGEGDWWHVSLFDRVAVTDASQGGVRVRRHDPAHLRAIGRDGARVLWRFAREGSRAARSWRHAMPRLTSADNWERLFGGS